MTCSQPQLSAVTVRGLRRLQTFALSRPFQARLSRQTWPDWNEKGPVSRAFPERMMGLEPTTFCMASRRSSQLSYIRAAASIAPASEPSPTYGAGRAPR